MTNPHLKPRTVREWLELIPFDRARKEAIENCQKTSYLFGVSVYNLSDALHYAFVWSETDQGVQYWWSVRSSIIRMEESAKPKQEPPTMGMAY